MMTAFQKYDVLLGMTAGRKVQRRDSIDTWNDVDGTIIDVINGMECNLDYRLKPAPAMMVCSIKDKCACEFCDSKTPHIKRDSCDAECSCLGKVGRCIPVEDANAMGASPYRKLGVQNKRT